jgi:hypothetical protein
MSGKRCWHLAILVLGSSLTLYSIHHMAAAQTANAPQPAAQDQTPSNATYPQIVRIRSLEGDVRVARGSEDKKAAGADWEKAVAGLTLATGYSLVTGAGRAEIEFEDASTVYLADHSALTFNDIHTTGGVPYTQIALLSGTATLHVKPQFAGEYFTLKTPSGSVSSLYPEESYMRITSYLDSFTMTFLQDTSVELPGTTRVSHYYAKGLTLVDHGGGRVNTYRPPTSDTAWDKWVDDRVTAHAQAEQAMLKDSGLTEPIPGLADMNGQGHFFPCAPYGSCWEPNAVGEEPLPGEGAAQAEPAQAATNPASLIHPKKLYAYDTSFPCSPDQVHSLVERDLVTHQEKTIWSRLEGPDEPYTWPYSWAVCHTGFWLYQRQHYVWVVGHKRHHHRPIRWVKLGHSVAFVPLHPNDKTGKPPINRQHEAYVVHEKEKSVERIAIDPGREVKVLNAAPKDFRKPFQAPLERAEAPRVEVHRVGEPVLANKGTAPALAFDHKTQSFLLARQVAQGGKSTTVMEPFNGAKGNLQARAVGMDARGNYSVRMVAGGTNRGSGGGVAGGGNGGASRGGNSGGTGGGFSHGGAGSSAGAPSSGASSGGGAHGGSGGSVSSGSGGASSTGGSGHH